ncbi:MAG: RHS repeat-associated core domain-containing protein [Verrucomicrobiota bacterium]
MYLDEKLLELTEANRYRTEVYYGQHFVTLTLLEPPQGQPKVSLKVLGVRVPDGGGTGSFGHTIEIVLGDQQTSGGSTYSVSPASLPDTYASYSIPLGVIEGEFSSGVISFSVDGLVDTPDANFSTFNSLILETSETAVTDPIRRVGGLLSGGLSQVAAINGLFVIRDGWLGESGYNRVPLSEGTFEVIRYPDYEGSDPYIPLGSANELWRFEQVGTEATANLQMKVTHIRNPGQSEEESDWELFERIEVSATKSGTPAGARETGWRWTSQSGKLIKDLYWEEEVEFGAETPLYETVVYYDNRSGSPVFVSAVESRLEKFGAKGWKTTREIEDPGGANRVTEWNYEEDTGSQFYGLLRSVEYPDGSWEYTAVYDDQERALETWRPWKEVTLVQAIAANGSNCELTLREYDPEADVRYRTTRKIEDVMVSKRERRSGGINRRYTSATEYLDTITNGRSYMPESVIRPDDTQTTYVRENGYWDGYVFHLTDPGNAEEAFRKTTKEGTVFNPEGIPNQTTWRRTISVDGDPVRAQTLLYVDSENQPIIDQIDYSTTWNDPAPGWRTEKATNLSGRILWTELYDSDDLLRERIAESGISTEYTYDLLDRRSTETRSGLTTTFHYDPLGRIEGTTLTPEGQTSPKLTTSRTYYPTGEVHTSTDRNGLQSTYTYTNGGRTVTLTRPDTSTEITESYLDGQIKSITGTGVVHQHFTSSVEADGMQVTRTEIGSSGSPRWSEYVTDWAGRTVERREPAYSGATKVTKSFYNALGQLWKQTRTGLGPLLYTYNDLGILLWQGVDLNGNDVLDEASAEPITETVSDYNQVNSDWYHRTITRRWLTDDSAVATDMSKTLRQLTGFSQNTLSYSELTDIYGEETSTTVTVDSATQTVTQTIDLPDTTRDAVSVTINGRLDSSTDPRIPAAENATTRYTYDQLGRLETMADPTGAITTQTYYPNSSQLKTIEPEIGAITEFTYYGQGVLGAGQVQHEFSKTPGGTAVLSQIDTTYDAHGRIKTVGGSGTYPVEYGYDPTYGDQTTLKTFRDGTTPDTTTWIYQPSTGLLTRKQYADAKGTDYTYHDSSLLHTREWERGITTTYTYDLTGQPDLTDYSDDTIDIDWDYDRAGRLDGVVDAAGTHDLDYADDGQLLTHRVTAGLLNGVRVSNAYPNYGKREFLEARMGSMELFHQYTYDPDTGRLETATDRHPETGAQYVKATYAYKPNTHLTETITLANDSFDVLTREMTYDELGRVDTVIARNGGLSVINSHDYTYDDRGRRNRNDREDGSYWSYGYNDRNEVESGVKLFANETVIPGHDFSYTYDDIGNRDDLTINGETLIYGANALNQITSLPIASDHMILGNADPDAVVFVNGEASQRNGDLWSRVVSVDNSTNAVSLDVTIESLLADDGPTGEVLIDSMDAGTLFVPQTPVVPTYDDDGNLTQDGRWSYKWNAENRLISMETIPSAYNAGAPREKLDFVYDFQGRRVQKVFSIWDSTSEVFIADYTTLFAYDGWNLIVESTTAGGTTDIQTYLWGLDLSGGMQGAGGVGGLLAMKKNGGQDSLLPFYDGNGNVYGIVGSGQYTDLAQYEYGPFGEPIRESGSAASRNPFTFSTKFRDEETGLSYYGFRYYDPQTGRWLNRDPIEEAGGLNLYRFVGNDGVNAWDLLGLQIFTFKYETEIDWERFSFAGYIFNGGLKTSHEITFDTDTEEFSSTQPFVGKTFRYNKKGEIIDEGEADGSTIIGRVDEERSEKGCKVVIIMEGNEINPLVFGPTPGITYEVTITIDLVKEKIEWFVEHDRFPSHSFYVQGKREYHFSHIESGTTPRSLLPFYPNEEGEGERCFIIE